MRNIIEIAKKKKILIFEDCCEAHGAAINKKKVGSFGDISAFSFFVAHNITTGEGGMLISNNEVLINKASLLRDHGMDKKRRYWHLEVGYNYRMTNLQAALGVAQMERVRDFVSRKREIAKKYQEFLGGRDDLIHPLDSLESVNSFWLYTIMLKDFSRGKRDLLLEELSMHGIESRPVFYPADMMPLYKKYANQNLGYFNSRKISEQGLSLPTGVSMGDKSIKRVCEALITSLDNIEK
jgi:perosamine synthetase